MLYTPRPLEVVDTTLRDGQQTSLLHDHHKYFFTRADKEDMVRALIIYGVKFIELFAPVVSAQEAEDWAALRAVRDSLIMQKGYTFLLAHVRCHPRDVEAALAAGADGLNVYMGTSPQSQRLNHGRALDVVARTASDLLAEVRQNHPNVLLRFSGEDAFRTPLDDLCVVYDAVVPHVHRLGLPDTVGVATPASVARRVQALRQRYPHVALEGHFHDDRGLALVNALEAIRHGVTYMNTTVLGVAERSGITSLTALLFNLHLDKNFDALEGYHLRGSYPINVLVADKLNMLVPSKEPVSLTNRTHTAGVHQNAVLNGFEAYEAHPLDLFGVTEGEMLLGPLSGWNAVHYFLKEIRYYPVDEDRAKAITTVFKERVYQRSPEISPEEVLVDIAEREFGLAPLQLSPARHPIVQRLDAPNLSHRPVAGVPVRPRA